MTAQTKTAALVQWIRSVLAQGLPLSESVQDYMEATFGTSDLAVILHSDTGSDLDSLMELLFFPDVDLQMAYEAMWGDEPFTQADLKAIQNLLGREPLTVPVDQTAHSDSMTFIAPEFALRALVQRLNITWQPAQELVDTLSRQWKGHRATWVRVHLRHSRLVWHENQIRLMAQFLSKMPPEADDAKTCLKFLLNMMSELTPREDPFQFLITKKFFFFNALCKAEDFERKRNASNMEIMMLQGNRAAHGSIAQWRQHMQWIDRICHTIFGQTQFFQQPGDHCVDLDTDNHGKMIEEIMRSLS